MLQKPNLMSRFVVRRKSNELRSALMREYVLMSVAITSGRRLSKLSRAAIREINAVNHYRVFLPLYAKGRDIHSAGITANMTFNETLPLVLEIKNEIRALREHDAAIISLRINLVPSSLKLYAVVCTAENSQFTTVKLSILSTT
jgi:hypothetical protein